MGYVFDALGRAGDPQPDGPGDEPTPAGRSLSEAALEAALQKRAAAADDADADAEPWGDEPPAIADAQPELEPESDTVPFPSGASAPIGDPNDFDERLVSIVDPASQMAEEYRGIRTSLLARWEQKRHLVHTITSATPQEGKTITSLNLGLSFAELRNRSVLAVEADLRLPTFAKLLKLDEGKGMVHLLRNEASLEQVIQTVPGTRLKVIPAGERCASEAVQLLSSPRATEVLQALRAKFDHVIIDTPPVTELADAGILGAQSDEVLMIVRMNHTPRPLVEQAIRTLKGYGATIAGVIATDQQRSRHKHYYYRYGYQYRYSGRAA